MKPTNRRRGVFISLLFVGALLMICQPMNAKVHGLMGEETVGNKPLNDRNYTAWKNIMPVANHKTRVYHTWVNGDERFYYQGNIEQLNQLLENFSLLEQDVREIIILPGPGSVSNFDRDQKFSFNCEMHLVGGIAKHQSGLDKGNLFWPSHPRLTIRIDDQIDLEALKIPASCRLVSPNEMKQRYTDGLTSSDETIRGWGAGYLANLNPHDREALKSIASLLDDKNDWVALNSITVLGSLGNQAREFLPRLETIATSKLKSNAEAAETAIASIKAANVKEQIENDEQQKVLFQSRLEVINRFIDNNQTQEPR
ncbi:MAG: HEAT repeat domain-containing protein [Pirellulaceae bacterium]